MSAEQSSPDDSERDTATCPICEGTARKMRREPRYICNDCARYLSPDEVASD